MKLYICLINFLICTFSVNAQLTKNIWTEESVGNIENFIIDDIDADNSNEILTFGQSNYSTSACVLKYNAQQGVYPVWQTHGNFYSGTSGGIYVARMSNALRNSIGLLSRKSFDIYDPQFKLEKSIPLKSNLGLVKSFVQDLNNDGIAELAFYSYDSVRLYDLRTGNKINSIFANHCKDALVGNMNTNNSSELFLMRSDTSWVINPISGKIIQKISIPNFNFYHFYLEDIDNDNISEIVGLGLDTIITFKYPYLSYKKYKLAENLTAIDCFYDIDKDGLKECVINSYDNKVKFYSFADKAVIRVDSLPIAPLNLAIKGEHGNDLLYFSNDRLFYIYNLNTNKIDYTLGEFKYPVYQPLYANRESEDSEYSIYYARKVPFLPLKTQHIVCRNGKDFTKSTIIGSQLWANYDYGYPFTVAKTRDEKHVDYVFNYNYDFRIFDTKSEKSIGNIIDPDQRVFSPKVEDLNLDGIPEIITSTVDGQYKIYNYYDGVYKLIWESEKYFSPTQVFIFNVDNTPKKELIIYNEDSKEYNVFESDNYRNIKKFHWSSSSTLMNVSDYNSDGVKEYIFKSDESKWLEFVSAQDYSLVNRFHCNTRVTSVDILNIDSTRENEIIIHDGDSIRFLNSDLKQFYSMNARDSNITKITNIIDLDQDGYFELLCNTSSGYSVQKILLKSKNFKQPYVLRYVPDKELSLALNEAITLYFNKSMNASTFTMENIRVKGKIIDYTDLVFSYDDKLKSLTIKSSTGWHPGDSLHVTLSPNVTDNMGNKLDGNTNEIEDDEETDKFSIVFATAENPDVVGPSIDHLYYSNTIVYKNESINLQGNVMDVGTPQSPVVDVEYFVDNIGEAGEGLEAEAFDRRFDQISEDFLITIYTGLLSAGRHVIYLHAKDQCGNWGNWSELGIEIFEDLSDNWLAHGYNETGSGFNFYSFLHKNLRKIWTIEKEADDDISAVSIANGRVFFTINNSSTGSSLNSLDLESGNVNWKNNIESPLICSRPYYSQGSVFVSSILPPLGIALNKVSMIDGSIIFKQNYLEGMTGGKFPTFYKDIIIAESSNLIEMTAIQNSNGNNAWNLFNEKGGIDGNRSFIISKDTIFSYHKGNLLVSDYRNNQLYWSQNFNIDAGSNDLYTQLVIDEVNHVLIITTQERYYAIDLKQRKLAWTLANKDKLHPASRNGNLYLIEDGKLVCRNSLSGTILYEYNNATPILFPPVLSNACVYVSDNDHTWGYNPDNTDLIFELSNGGEPAINNHYLILVNNKYHTITAFSGSSLDNKNIVEEHTFTVWPNPATNILSISQNTQLSNQAIIQICTLSGEVLQTQEVSFNSGQINVNISHLLPGTYLCGVNEDGICKYVKFVKM